MPLQKLMLILSITLLATACKKKSNGTASATVTTLNCAGVSFSSTSTVNVAYTGIATVPYTGGNGITYAAGTGISSLSVTGLTATLASGTLASGAGTIIYVITGTATTTGIATFPIVFGSQSCTISLTVNAAGGGGGGTCAIPTVFTTNYKSGVALTGDCNTITLKSNGTPDHVSPYWGSGHAMYEAPFSGQNLNPGTIGTQNYSMTITASPVEASNKEATSLGPIGMALNGVPIYNDREGGNVPVDAGVLSSMDRGGAHPGPGNTYHYHFNGDFTSVNDAKLIGWLRDGFPIYGRKDTTGIVPTNLDANGGHTGPTQNYPNGIYHYHCSNVAYLNSRFYILKSGSYHGTKGTFTF